MIQKLQYPKLHHDEKLNTKLTISQILYIKQEYRYGSDFRQLASEYNVSIKTIRYWIDDLYRERVKESQRKRRKHLHLTKKEKLKARIGLKKHREFWLPKKPLLRDWYVYTSLTAAKKESGREHARLREQRKRATESYKLNYKRGVYKKYSINARRFSRKHSLSAFRMFWDRMEGGKKLRKLARLEYDRKRNRQKYQLLLSFRRFWGRIENGL